MMSDVIPLVQVKIGRQNLAVQVQVDDNTDYTMDMILAHPVQEQCSSYKILKTKVEIQLKKATAVRWETLEQREEGGNTNQRNYPTSNRRNPVDWDKVEAEVIGRGENLNTSCDSFCEFNS